MNVRFWIEPNVSAPVNQDSGSFEPYTTYRDLFFKQLAEETAGLFVFANGTSRLCVAESHVFRYEWNGSEGHCRPCG